MDNKSVTVRWGEGEILTLNHEHKKISLGEIVLNQICLRAGRGDVTGNDIMEFNLILLDFFRGHKSEFLLFSGLNNFTARETKAARTC